MGTLHGKERWTIVVIYKVDRTMLSSSIGSIFVVTGTLWDESTCHWVPLKKASGAGFGAFFDLRLTNIWANNEYAGALRRRRAHYDVTVILCHWLYETDSIIRGDIIIKGFAYHVTPRPMWDICQLYPYSKVYRIVSGSKTTDDINWTKTMYIKNICILYGVCHRMMYAC